MRSKNRRYLIFILLLFVALVVLKHYMPKSVNWDWSFDKESKSPYGCRIMHDMLDSIFPDQLISVNNSSPYIALQQNENRYKNLIIITSSFEPDDLDLDALLDYAGEGNNVFISAMNFSDAVCDTLRLKLRASFLDTSLLRNTKTSLSLYNPEKDTPDVFMFKGAMPAIFFVSYDTLKSICLGNDQRGNPDFLVTAFGKGKIFLHSQPLAYTNYYLLTGSSDYACRSMSYLPEANSIWDQYYKPGRMINLSPVRYILSQPAFRSAYYLAMVTILIYMIFGSKRKQQIIQVIKPDENTSLKFLITVGRLYYRSRNYIDLARKKTIYFHEFLRNRYYLHTITGSDEHIRLLALKSGVDVEVISQLLKRVGVIDESRGLDRKGLIEYHRLLETFYSMCK